MKRKETGLGDLSLGELKTILLKQQEAMGLCQHPDGLLKISSTLSSCNFLFTNFRKTCILQSEFHNTYDRRRNPKMGVGIH
jgi:hypothetical protein